jgi:pimeloyl-ACP methyl ester carboxylesterase
MDYLHTPALLELHVFQRRGCPLHIWTAGDAEKPVVVMLHGATMDHRMFNAQVEALAPAYRVLVWDARGHGQSQPGGDELTLNTFVEDLVQVLDEFGVGSCVVLGQSMGGYIAQHLYRRTPERVQALIVIGSTPISKAYSRLEIFALKATNPMFRVIPYSWFARAAAEATAVQPAVQHYALETVRTIPKHEFRRIWRAVTQAIDTRGQPGARMDVPLLLLHGAQDTRGTIKRDMPLWAQDEPQAEYHLIPNAGHNANQDNPDAVNTLVLDFLKRHTG